MKSPLSPQIALDGILATAGWTGRGAWAVAFSGADPVLATNFRLGTAGSVALAAQGLAADALHHLRTGRHQDLAIDHRAGALAMRSNQQVRLKDGRVGAQWANLSGLYPCRDGRWVQLHCNYPWLKAGILGVLGLKDTDERETVAAAVMKWDAAQLEAAMAAPNLPAYMIRAPEEWRRHPQAAAVAELPVMEIIKIGEAPREPLPSNQGHGGDRPLSGIRVAELARVIAGPVCGRTLAEHGADVLRVGCAYRPDDTTLAMDTGHGKRSTHLDLRDPAEMDALKGLLRQADIMTQGHRPGTISGRGLSPEAVADLRPGIVYVTLSAWSHVGPWSHRRGFDSLVQCATGMAYEQGGAETPRHLPAQAIDYVSGYLAAFGAMEGLRRRATEGGSWLVRVSLAQTGRWIDGLGRVGGPEALALADPTTDDVMDLVEAHETEWGTLEHLKPALGMSETPPRWDLPAAPIGSHDPVWIATQ